MSGVSMETEEIGLIATTDVPAVNNVESRSMLSSLKKGARFHPIRSHKDRAPSPEQETTAGFYRFKVAFGFLEVSPDPGHSLFLAAIARPPLPICRCAGAEAQDQASDVTDSIQTRKTRAVATE